jgi:hypothetical protein
VSKVTLICTGQSRMNMGNFQKKNEHGNIVTREFHITHLSDKGHLI